MSRYEVSTRTTIVTTAAGTPIASLRAGSRPAAVREIHLWSVTAPTTRGELALARSTALGTGALTSVAPTAYDSTKVASTAAAVSAWATLAPTVAATWLRRFSCTAAIGQGIVWKFDGEGLIVPTTGVAAPNSELVLLTISGLAPGTWDVTYAFDE